MHHASRLKYRDRFNKAIDRAICECSRATGATDLETVYRYLRKDNSILFRRVRADLADEHVRVLIQKRMKRCRVSVAEAADLLKRDAEQPEFDFFEMEQFRGMSKRITFTLADGTVQYVEYNRSTEAQRDGSIALLTSGIAADMARRDTEEAARAWLHPLVVRYGDLPADQLVALWRAEEGRVTGAGAV